ncbi:MAG: DUF1553 domain-containing protein, partial [Planctomycetota bacterium]|nr:DUF1553 domain-containing protein [Planctomycetota bacterium]
RRRRAACREETEYWKKRHEFARRRLRAAPLPAAPKVSRAMPVFNAIDRYVGKRLEKTAKTPTPMTRDWEFLRRLSLDVRGVIPTSEEVEAFQRDSAPGRRRRWIDRFLDDPRWADHWVAYWQDVLAENPGILKPKLNNTGPFRWWIHESFLDNKPMDRFVSELILMEGSKYGGSPAAFAVASQNDVPMAAKAHVLGTAFLGVQLKCSRCHDSPYHPYRQRDLFGLAAMLRREPQEVPKSSSVPLSPEELESKIIEVTLAPGSRVEPAWMFPEISPATPPEELLRRPGDTRDRLAAIVTSPDNERFVQVVANRLWKRYLGHGLVEPADDWEGNEPSHPHLLRMLGRELATHGYDLKHLARLILNSHVYQRRPDGDANRPPEPAERLFRGPARRRLTAEQLVDSLFWAVSKEFGSEPLNLDVDGRRPVESFLNLGVPRRSWEFASLSNERDRPALALPVAQSVIDVLKAFGWRESRQDPVTTRPSEATVIQPLSLANGVVVNRVTTLSDDSAVLALCLEEDDLDEIVRQVYLRLLSRPPGDDERLMFRELLASGFAERRLEPDGSEPRPRRRRHAVSWSNHLSAEATRIKMEMELAALEGDPPTRRLAADWRRRMEDMLWALVNSPEFLFVP